MRLSNREQSVLVRPDLDRSRFIDRLLFSYRHKRFFVSRDGFHQTISDDTEIGINQFADSSRFFWVVPTSEPVAHTQDSKCHHFRIATANKITIPLPFFY